MTVNVLRAHFYQTQ